MQKLPIGVQSFEVMRSQNFVYVDKTEGIHQLVTEGLYYFLARPRRFGKSLLVSTLKCLFEAKRELFAGLWIDAPGRWEWQPSSVVVLDFNGLALDSAEQLTTEIWRTLDEQAQAVGLTLQNPSIVSRLKELILGLHRLTGQGVVVLIDEYDKPLVQHLGKGAVGLAVAQANREVLRGLYGVLKETQVATVLRFVLLTGISRFSRVSVFSALNNLNDISLQEDYATLLGYTAAELQTYFTTHIAKLATKLKCSAEEAFAQLTHYYNGYRFSSLPDKVYNPFSVLMALNQRKLRNHWFETGTPTFLVNLLREQHYAPANLEKVELSEAAFSTFELERLIPEALLFQTGYLTIHNVEGQVYTLGYPNQEVKTGFNEALLLAIEGISPTVSSHVSRLAQHLQAENLAAFFETLTAIFAAIPYDIQTKRDEGYYHSLCYLALSASGGAAQSSVLTGRGRIDMVLTFPDKVYILEFKCGQSAQVALQQIKDKGYAEPYRQSSKRVILLGLNFSLETRNVVEWAVES